MTQQTISPRAWIDLLLLGLLWGGSFVAIRIALDEIGPLTVVLHRVGWAMLALWLVAWMKGLRLPKAPGVWAAFVVMGLLNNVIPFGLMSWGQLYIEAGLTSILNAATAIFGVIVAALFFADERLTSRKVIGVVLGFLGVATAIGLENFRTFDLRSLGQVAVICGAVSYAFAAVWARKTLSDQPPQVAAAGMLTGSTLIMLPLVWWFEGPVSLALESRTLLAIAYYSLFATAIAYLLYYRILAAAGSGNLMLVTLLIPPISIVLGAYLLDEALPPSAYGGFALLAAGLLVLDGRIWRLLRGSAR